MFPQIFGKYVLERELSSGGMARVYLATLRGAVGFEKRLVVKQIRPELALDEAFVRRFVEEAKIAVELNHPNIVPVYELGVEQGIYYIAMELCEGLTLTEVLNETGPLDTAEGAYVGVEICRALDYAHRRAGIVHRDVTPRNVLLDEEGAVRLIDFGIAAPVLGVRAEAPQEVFGSPGHMPPEQLRGETLTPATDVFAVAVLLIEAWTGRPPYRRGTYQASAEALREKLPNLGAEHAELAPIAGAIARAAALDITQRTPDAEALGRKLRDFARPFDSGDVAKRLGERVRRALRRSRRSVPWHPGEATTPHTEAATPGARAANATPTTPALGITGPSSEPVTRTFAARDDLVEWTRKIASLPPGPSEPGGPRSAPRLPGGGEDSTSPHARSSQPAPGGRARALLGAGVLVAIGLMLALSSRPTPQGADVLARQTSSTNTQAPLVAGLIAPTASAVLTKAATSSTEPRGSEPQPQPPARPARSASQPSKLEPSAPGQLKLTADPSALVTVVGAKFSETHPTPVRGLRLPPGKYSLTFRSPTFGSPVVASVDVASGAKRSVHVDFRAALPTVDVR
jgi:serine/threonine-protein kinase